jgi:mannan endo-1,4-beta-mannosidase
MQSPILKALASAVIISGLAAWAAEPAPSQVQPATPHASPEARALLETLYAISGQHTLTGQHNYPNTKSRNSQFAAQYIGRTPAVFSTDWGHAQDGNTDSYRARPDIVQEAIRQHRLGALVTICWHAVPPTADEPVTFRQLPGSDPKKLASVQGRLLDEQFRDVLTPGTALYDHWCAQVDAVAVFLKQLGEAHVPVLWRPYHEMNGDWFWWGGRPGEKGTAALYRQLFDRLVNHNHLTNLLWVWSVDRASRPGLEHAPYFPGVEYVDILSLDVYGSDFAQSYYDSLVALARGKPLALAEVGNPPTPEILAQQPRWTFYVTWAGMVRNTSRKQYDALMRDPRVLNLGDPAHGNVMAAYRKACDLPLLADAPAPLDFSGSWVLNEDNSEMGRMGAAFAPARLEVVHRGNNLTIRSTRILEYADDQVTEEQLTLDGAEAKSEFMNSPRVTTAHLSPAGDSLVMDSTIALVWGPPGSKLITQDTWKMSAGGKVLTIQRSATSFMGAQTVTLVFDRR